MNKSEYSKEYYQANREKIIERSKRRYLAFRNDSLPQEQMEKIKKQRLEAKQHHKVKPESRKKACAYSKQYAKEHVEERKVYMQPYLKQYRKENWEQCKVATNRWKREHKESRCLEATNRRALQRQAEGKLSLSEWLEIKRRYKFHCPACGRYEPEIKLSIDHIVPLIQGGSNHKENIQPLCISCNARKQKKIAKWNTKGQMEFVI